MEESIKKIITGCAECDVESYFHYWARDGHASCWPSHYVLEKEFNRKLTDEEKEFWSEETHRIIQTEKYQEISKAITLVNKWGRSGCS